MKNFMTWQGFDPLTIRIIGSGEYVAKELVNLDRTWHDAMVDKEEEIRQDQTDYHFND